MSKGKKRYGQISMDGVPGYCLPIHMFGALSDELMESDLGMSFEVKTIELEDEEFDNLNEFEGW